MMKRLGTIGVLLCAAGLYGCAEYNPYGYANYRSYVYEERPLYPEVHDQDLYYYKSYATPSVKREVLVPETYHMSAYRPPVSHMDQDRSWVEGQNPQGYTIELADKEKASEVAGTLMNAPKKDRMAQIRYQRDGKSYYKGLYGTFPSYEAAQQALGALPLSIKDGSNIKSWGNVQSSVNH